MSAITVMMVAMVLVIGGILAITPSLTPQTECFAVTVPPYAQDDSRIRSLKSTYVRATLGVAVVCALVFALIGWNVDPSDNAGLFNAAAVVSTCVPLVASLALMLWCRSRVRAIKQEEGWSATTSQAAAVIGADDTAQPLSLLWDLLYLPVIAGIVIAGVMLYDRYPEQVPMHVGFDGTVTDYASKSLGTALFPALIAALLALCLAFAHWSILRSKRPVDPAAPATSAYAYGVFSRVQSIILLISGLILCTVIGVCFHLSALGIISLAASGIIVAVAGFGFAFAELWASIVLGQSGSKLAAELRTSDELAKDDDARWPLGIFYFNPSDPSIIVPKRFGVGWTMNVARPATWALFAGLIVLILAFLWATYAMTGVMP